MVQDLLGRHDETTRLDFARALKEKSRIAGRIHTLTDVINHENDIRVNYDLRLEKLNPQD